MRICKQNRPDLAHLAEMIDGIDVVMLASNSRNGELENRPMTPIEMDEGGALWFFIRRHSPVFDGTGPVNLAFVDHERSIYVSICASAAQVDDRARMRDLWTPMARPWFPQGPDSPDLSLLRVLPTTADIWDAPHNKMVRLLAIAASVVTGQPFGLGGHERLEPQIGGAPLRPAGAT